MESIGEDLPTGQTRTASDKWGQYRDESLPFNRSAASHTKLHRPKKYPGCVKILPAQESPTPRLAKPPQPLSLDSAVGYQPAPRCRENLKKHGYGGVHVAQKEPKKSCVFWPTPATKQSQRGGSDDLHKGCFDGPRGLAPGMMRELWPASATTWCNHTFPLHVSTARFHHAFPPCVSTMRFHHAFPPCVATKLLQRCSAMSSADALVSQKDVANPC